jgi:hypothetical protein
MKEAKNLRAGKVGVSKAVNISKKSEWESQTGGTRPESNRSFGKTLIHSHSKQSNHEPGLTEFEKNSGHDPRVRKGSPTGPKKFGK